MLTRRLFGRGGLLTGLGLLVLIAGVPPMTGAVRAANPPKPAISEDAAAALGQMGQALQAKQFSFQVRTLRVYAGDDGRFLHIGHSFKILVRRPDRLRVDIDGDDGVKQLFYDGKTFTVYVPDKNAYVSFPVPDTLDGMFAEARKRIGLDFPLVDLLEKSPHESLLKGVTEAKVVNDVTIGGVPSRHLTLFQPPGMEQEFWLAKTAQSLPERLFITFRSQPGQPNFIATFSDWNLSATPTDADFVFQAPAGAAQVDLKSVSPAAAGRLPAKGNKGATQ
jgi:hypothetical protein